MRKKQHVKAAADAAELSGDSIKIMKLILEIILDTRDMIEKQNEMIRRKPRGGKHD